MPDGFFTLHCLLSLRSVVQSLGKVGELATGSATLRGRRHNHAVPSANSTITQSSAPRGPSPACRASRAVTSGAVIAGATICGTAAARFQTPIAAASAPRGNTAYASAQSAVKNAPQAAPAPSPQPSATGSVGAKANAPTASAIAAPATVTTTRLSIWSAARPASTAPKTPATVKTRNKMPVVVRASATPSDSRTKKNRKPNRV